LYVGTPQNIATTGTHANRLYFSIQGSDGKMPTTVYRVIDPAAALIPFGGHSYWDRTVPTTPTYYEIYIYDKYGKKIILSSGYTGGTT
jgi:hypothetical protein